MQKATLDWHDYNYYPYEYELGIREIKGISNNPRVLRRNNRVFVSGDFQPKALQKLTYFSKIFTGGSCIPTYQARLENPEHGMKILKRQSTRYSVHGLHEYRGKFNPQIARSLLNILSAKEFWNVLDPFCGSGTTLVECAQMGIDSCGLDINPLAVYITNAKLKALKKSPRTIMEIGQEVITQFKIELKTKRPEKHTEREIYLKRWFSPETFHALDSLDAAIKLKGDDCKEVFHCVASNLLRNYSLQEPADLRIRRRKAPPPSAPLISAFNSSFQNTLHSLAHLEKIFGKITNHSRAYNYDSREAACLERIKPKHDFDTVITSPPYATALPYIDTQRLSLVWLNLLKPKQVAKLGSHMIGSRETNGHSKALLLSDMLDNAGSIPEKPWKYCLCLNDALTRRDGFRRKAMPYLLYRYLSDMDRVFKNVRDYVKPSSPFAMIVGNNHTVLGGKMFNIDTASLLIMLGKSNNWKLEENTKLQTYQRFGLHRKNSIKTENLIVLSNHE